MPTFLRLLLAAILSLSATPDRAIVQPGQTVTIAMTVTSQNGAHVELVKDDAYAPISGGISSGRCVWNGCVTGPGTATMTETIRIADDAAPGPLTLQALASDASGVYVIALVQLQIEAPAAASAVHFTALWDTATSATVQWTQVDRGCLYRESLIGERVFIGCYERFNATITLTFGHVGPLSGDQRPTAGDVYVLITGGATYRAPLTGRLVYMPLFF